MKIIALILVAWLVVACLLALFIGGFINQGGNDGRS